jgi:hypothetical protein
LTSASHHAVSPQDDDSVSLTFDIPKSGLPPYQPANFFNISYSGPEISLMVGMMDLHAIALAVGAKQGPVKVRPEITHRFFLSPRGLVLLKAMVDEMYIKLNEGSGGALDREKATLLTPR